MQNQSDDILENLTDGDLNYDLRIELEKGFIFEHQRNLEQSQILK